MRAILPADPPLSDIPIAEDSKVIGLFGGKGSGKSLLAAYLAQVWHKRTGRRVLYFPEDFNHVSGEPLTLREMFTGSQRMHGCILVWDEAQVLLNKFRSASHANRSLLAFLQHIRKAGAILLYTSNAPMQLDRGLAEQTDFHAYCKKYDDPRCKRFANAGGARRHLKFCNDWMRIDWIDTQGQTGVDQRYKDRRRRKREILPGIIRFYSLFNTYASVSANELAQFDKDKILDAYEEEQEGSTMADFVDQMRDWICEAVEQGATHAVPSTLAKTLSEQLDKPVSKERVGRALGELGLPRKRSKKSVRYELPARAELALWRSVG